MKIVRDIVIAVLLGVVAFLLFVYVQNAQDAEYVADEEIISEEETGESGGTGTTDVTTGAFGSVLVGPQCPAIQEGQDCPDAPFVGTVDFVVDDPERELIARVSTDESGNFAVTLPAGNYVVLVQHEGTFPICPEERVSVVNGQVAEVTMSCDSGIR